MQTENTASISTCTQVNNVELKMNEESVVELFNLKKEGFLKL